jgi:hypothetical protein
MRNIVKSIGGRVVLALLVIIHLAVIAPAQSRKATSDGMPMPMPQIAPIFIEGGQFTSVITVVNDVLANTPYEIVLHDGTGQTLATVKGEIAGHTQKQYKTSDLLKSTGPIAPTSTAAQSPAGAQDIVVGTIVLIPEGPGLAAQLSLTYHDGSAALHTEEEFAMPHAAIAAEYRGVAISAIGSPIIALKNTSAHAVHVSLKCIPEAEEISSTNLELEPNALRMVSGCADTSSNASVVGLLQRAGGQGSKGAFGISITSDASQDELSVFGFAWSNLPTRSLTSMNFVTPGALNSSDTGFAGVAVGSTPTLGSKPYLPLLALTNFSDSAVALSITEAFTATKGAPTTTVRHLTIEPVTTKTITLDTGNADSKLQNSILIQSSAAPGTVAAKLVSAAKSDAPIVEYQPKDLRQLENSGLHPWWIEHGLESTLLLFNTTTQDQYYNVKLYAGSAPWQKAFLLKSMETRAVGIGEIIRTQEPDDKGVKLAKDTVSGEVEWSTPGRWKGIGRILVSGGVQRVARNFSCGQCLTVCKTASIDPTSLNLIIDGVSSLWGQPDLCWSWDCYSCGSDQASGGGLGYSYYWWADNTSVASINGANNSDSAAFIGIASGGAYGNVDVSDGMGCDGTGSAPIDVNPTISKDRNLWWFGNGITPPTGFNLGGVTATLTATGAGNGTYVWTVTNGSNRLQFENGLSSITKTNTNTVGVSSKNFSTAANDVTVQLQFTPTGGTAMTVPYSLSIDSPYKMVPDPDNPYTDKSVNACSDTVSGGINGYKTQAIYTAISFFGVTLANIGINEDFASYADDYTGNNWPVQQACGTSGICGNLPSNGQFADTMCVVDPTGISLYPAVYTPQNPLWTVKIDHASQFWYVGSGTPAVGVEVQSDTQQYYQDHARHLNITSPVR